MNWKKIDRYADRLKGLGLIVAAGFVGWRGSFGVEMSHASVIGTAVSGLFALCLFGIGIMLLTRRHVSEADNIETHETPAPMRNVRRPMHSRMW